MFSRTRNALFSIGFFFMRKTISILSFLLAGTVFGIAQPMTDIRIVSEDQHSIVLEFTPRIQAAQILGTQGTVFTRFRFYESQTTYDVNGRADFIRTVLLLLPSPQYSLQILASEYQIRDTVKLLPQPTIKPLKEFGVMETYDDTSFSKTVHAPAQTILAELIRVENTSTGCMGTLVLHPIQAMDQEKVKVYSRITVRLDFSNAFPAGLVSSCLMRGSLPQKTQLVNLAKGMSRQSVNEDSTFTQSEFYRFEVTENGIYKLNYDYFRQLNIPLTDINSVKLYGNGGLAIPDDNTSPRPNTLVEIARLVVRKNSNGSPDPEDYILFYGRGVRGWRYTGGTTFQHYIHPYAGKNYYFFTVAQGGGRQMDTLSASSVSPPTIFPASFQEKIFAEEERYNLINSGRQWVGRLYTGTGNTDSYSNQLSGLVASSVIEYQFKFAHRSPVTNYLNIYDNGQLLGYYGMGAFGANDEISRYAEIESRTASRTSGSTPNEASSVSIQMTASNPDSKAWLDWMEIYYQRRFEAVNDYLQYTTGPDVTGSAQYVVSNFSSDMRAFDVTDHSNVKELKYNSSSATICTLQIQQTAGSVREIAIVGKNGVKIPAAAIRMNNTTNLHNTQLRYDFIIISPPEFLSEANRLKTYRESHDGLQTIVVDINQIYNEFSGGLPDPLALREFLRYTQTNWQSPVPQFVLLFGWGHYDYKNISTTQRNWIPPYETEESLDPTESYPTDDKFSILGLSGSVYSIALGRLPARNLQEASVMVSKIISYENSSPIDPWRNRITFVADDGKTSTSEDNGSQFTFDTETLAESYTPASCDKTKIYLVEYPTLNSASGRRKPDVNKAIVDAVNQGTLIVNYIGHGNERLWAHEAVLTREDNLPQLVNRDRLSFTVAATCSFGKYDNPGVLSGGEQFVTMEQGGAIASLVTSRVVYNSSNVALNDHLFSWLFLKDGDGKNRRLGEAVRLAKSNVGNSSNTQKFHLFGDPTLRLLIPENLASIDSINGDSTRGAVIMIKSLENMTLKGMMKQNGGIPMTSFQGKGILQMFDSQREITIQDGAGLFVFKKNGSLIFRGSVSINNGQYAITIPIPKDVTFGSRSRISMYAWNTTTDGTGFTENVMINGVDSTVAVDSTGPQISIYLDDLNFRAGDIVKKNPILIVRLADGSGINTSTAGVGHQLSATLSNPDRILDLSNYYLSDSVTYKMGEVRYPLHDLSDGKYSLRVKAWDIQNNSSETETFFEVHNSDDMALLNVVNYPNPFSRSTTFLFQRNVIDPIDVEIRIFSIAGRRLGNLRVQNITERSVRIPWDGKDAEGADLANGIYLYKLIVRSQNGQQSNETIGKVAIVH
jgi:hypothetical protein